MNHEKNECLENRYQNQNWFVRRWRDRYLLLIPWKAVYIYWYNGPYAEGDKDSEDWDPLSFSGSWFIACGLCDTKREYWYSWDETIDRLDRTKEDLKDNT